MKDKNKAEVRSLSNLLKSASNILYKPQTTLRRIKGKLTGKTYSWDTVGFKESVTINSWNLKKKVIFKINEKTGQREEIPMTEEEIKHFTEIERKKNSGK